MRFSENMTGQQLVYAPTLQDTRIALWWNDVTSGRLISIAL
jgi:hypothetical protein